MQLLAPVTITTALAGVLQTLVSGGTTWNFRTQGSNKNTPRNLTILGKLTYGSGGTTFDAYLQTSFDGGVTWTDVCNFHGTTASFAKYFNINSQGAALSTPAQTDGTITSDTAKDGTLGALLRVKLTTTGTYAGGTTFELWISGEQQ